MLDVARLECRESTGESQCLITGPVRQQCMVDTGRYASWKGDSLRLPDRGERGVGNEANERIHTLEYWGVAKRVSQN